MLIGTTVNARTSTIAGDSLEALLQLLTAEGFACGFAPSPYETLAIIAAPFDQSMLGPAWETQRARLLHDIEQQQASDGSWGSDHHDDFPPDRIITTLAALAALDHHDQLGVEQRDRAVAYLQGSIPVALTTPDAKKPIAFEALLVQLLCTLERRGLAILPATTLASLLSVRDARLAKKQGQLTRGRGTIHSILDAMPATGLEWERIAAFQECDGSMGIYPSSTAALLANLTRESPALERGASYLRAAQQHDGSLPPFYPSAEFERWWSLLALAQSPLKDRVHLPPWLTEDVPVQGISVARSFSLPDVDTASMKATTLITLGRPVDLHYLSSFHRHGVFECYEHEHRVSPSANIHALMAIVAAMESAPASIQRSHHLMVASSMDYLLETLGAQDHYEDKWHLSDLYTTAHALELFAAMLALPSFPCRPALEQHVRRKLGAFTRYLLDHHNQDGGFGFRSSSTVEETGYASHALCVAASQGMERVPIGVLAHAADYLRTHEVDDDPPLWLGKTLYRSPIITAGQKLGAQSWLAKTLERAPS